MEGHKKRLFDLNTAKHIHLLTNFDKKLYESQI